MEIMKQYPKNQDSILTTQTQSFIRIETDKIERERLLLSSCNRQNMEEKDFFDSKRSVEKDGVSPNIGNTLKNQEQINQSETNEQRISDNNVQETQNNLIISHNENINLSEITRTDGNNLVITHQTTSSRDHLWEPEVKVYIVEVFGFFLALFFLSVVWLQYGPTQEGYEWILAVINGFLLFIEFINIFWTKKILGDLWEDSHYIYQIADSGATFCSTFLIYFRLLNILPLLSYACIPLVLYIFVIQLFSMEEKSKKMKRLLCRSVYSAQILLVTLKIDGFLNWEWSFILIPTGVYLSFKVFDWFKHLSALIKLYHLPNPRVQTQNANTQIKKIGFVWYVLYYEFSFIGLFALIGVSEQFGSNQRQNPGLLNMAAYLNLFLSTYLLFYTIIQRKYLVEFIITFKLIDCFLAANAEIEVNSTKQKSYTLQSEKKEEHFVMISSTYFIPLTKDGTQMNTSQSSTAFCSCEKENSEHRKDYCFNKKMVSENFLCYICYINPADSILMGCGHGGVCYHCISQVVVENGQCVQCRKQVEGIYKIKTDPVFLNIYKGVEYERVIISGKNE